MFFLTGIAPRDPKPFMRAPQQPKTFKFRMSAAATGTKFRDYPIDIKHHSENLKVNVVSY